MILFLLSAFLILDFDSLRKRETYSFHQTVHPSHYSCHLPQISIFLIIFHKSQYDIYSCFS